MHVLQTTAASRPQTQPLYRPLRGATSWACGWCRAGRAGGFGAGWRSPFPRGWQGVGFLYEASRGWRRKAALGSGSVRALCCRGENGFSPDPVSALGLFEVTMCFSSPVQQSPGRLQKECSIRGQQRILSPAQGFEPRRLSQRGCGSRGPVGSGHGGTAWGMCYVPGPCRASRGKIPGFKTPWPKGAWTATDWICLSSQGCG